MTRRLVSPGFFGFFLTAGPAALRLARGLALAATNYSVIDRGKRALGCRARTRVRKSPSRARFLDGDVLVTLRIRDPSRIPVARIYRYDRSVAGRAETIELAVLGLLHEGPMHGYELRKRLNLMLGWSRVLSYGSLYPTLKKLLRATFIEESPGELTITTRRPRIVYAVTDSGHREFERLMSEVGPTAWEDDNFDIRFAFFGRTDMEIRLRVLEGRRSRLQERLDRVQKELAADAGGGRPLLRRAAAARGGVGRARGALALRPDQRGARPGPRPTQSPSSPPQPG